MRGKMGRVEAAQLMMLKRQQDEAVVKLQAGMRAKKVREEETMRKRRSSVGSADI